MKPCSSPMLFLYGAPASGKSFLAQKLSEAVGLEAIDLDEEIVRRTGKPIEAIFRDGGESAFRQVERAVLEEVIQQKLSSRCVVALGGGTLLDEENRRRCEECGQVVCLDTPGDEELTRRIRSQAVGRPLGNKAKERSAHYASFPHRLAGCFALPGSLVMVGTGLAPYWIEPSRTVFDGHIAQLNPELSSQPLAVIPSGEQHKTPETILALWHAFGEGGLGRRDRVTACGGGVTGDLTGFAAATWMRGMDWINVPTTLLAMVDASTGGKTGCDLPEGKNLVGAFHSPRLVVIDTDFLQTLPERELRSGRSEMIKHCLIGLDGESVTPGELQGIPTAAEIVSSLAVKVRIVEQDPLEKLGKRILLNCGHTIGHAVETASEYRLSHGEAVAIGCVEEARLAVKLGLAAASWPDELAACFQSAGLPVELPEGMSFQSLTALMRRDKKKLGRTVQFALPCGWGDVRACNVEL